MVIPHRVVQFAFLLGSHFEAQWRLLDVGRPGHMLPEEETDTPTPGQDPPPVPTPIWEQWKGPGSATKRLGRNDV